MIVLLSSETGQLFGWVFIIFTIICTLTYIIYDYFKNPFEYPYIRIEFDLSGKRQPDHIEFIDAWINQLNNPRKELKDMHNNELEQWEHACQYIISRAILWRSHKIELYQNIRNSVTDINYNMFIFRYFRYQTRYEQRNYQKTSYKVKNYEPEPLRFSLKELLEIDDELEEINYETTRKKYESKNQRRLMTPDLKLKIKKRDNYTCQNCGKYMPDEVGLHIDHIIPISKGGKSVESNLQVLCDKCNVRKGSKKKSVNSQPFEDESTFSFFDGFNQ